MYSNSLTTLNSKNTNQPPKKRSKRIPQPPKIPKPKKTLKKTKTKKPPPKTPKRIPPSTSFYSNNSASNLANINNKLNVKYIKYKLPSLNTVNKLEHIYKTKINLIDKYLNEEVDKIKVYHITFKKNLTSIFTTGLNIDYTGSGINTNNNANMNVQSNSDKLIYLTILPPLLSLYAIIYFNKLDDYLYSDLSYYNRIYTHGTRIKQIKYNYSLADSVLEALVLDFETKNRKLKSKLKSITSNKTSKNINNQLNNNLQFGLDFGRYIPVILEITLDKTFKNNINKTSEYTEYYRKNNIPFKYYDDSIGLTCNKTIPSSCIKVIKIVDVVDTAKKYNTTFKPSKDIIKFFTKLIT